jgi:hypothetical protein
MIFIHVLELIDLCVKNDILQDMDGNIPVYRKGTDKCNEGWHLTEKHRLAQELMKDDGGQKALISALKGKNVEFIPSDVSSFLIPQD